MVGIQLKIWKDSFVYFWNLILGLDFAAELPPANALQILAALSLRETSRSSQKCQGRETKKLQVSFLLFLFSQWSQCCAVYCSKYENSCFLHFAQFSGCLWQAVKSKPCYSLMTGNTCFLNLNLALVLEILFFSMVEYRVLKVKKMDFLFFFWEN